LVGQVDFLENGRRAGWVSETGGVGVVLGGAITRGGRVGRLVHRPGDRRRSHATTRTTIARWQIGQRPSEARRAADKLWQECRDTGGRGVYMITASTHESSRGAGRWVRHGDARDQRPSYLGNDGNKQAVGLRLRDFR
jgi:hypothetical protein